MRDHARGREIIDQILENMRGQVEELRYSKIVSSAYNVHLHADDYARIEGLVPEIVSQARRALDEELERLNRARSLEDKVRRWVGQPRVPYQRAGPEWSVSILPDPNEELEPGDILVDATLVTTDPDHYDGSRTQRIVTRRHGDVERRSIVEAGPAEPGGRALATLRWRDEKGEHVFRMVTPSIKIGRGGAAYWVDVKLEAAPDVSREHLRIRYDETSRGFFLQDLSSFGTTVNGVPVPSRAAVPAAAEGSAAPETAAAPPAEATEVPLPARATIGLAGVLALDFESEVRA